MKNQLSTTSLLRVLSKTPSLHEAIDFIGHEIDLCRYMSALINEAGMDIPTLAKEMLTGRSFVYQIFDGTRKPGRETLLKMALALRLDLPQTQRLLMLAQRGSLYPRVRRDAVIIYAIEHGYTLIQADEALCSVRETPLIQLIN